MTGDFYKSFIMLFLQILLASCLFIKHTWHGRVGILQICMLFCRLKLWDRIVKYNNFKKNVPVFGPYLRCCCSCRLHWVPREAWKRPCSSTSLCCEARRPWFHRNQPHRSFWIIVFFVTLRGKKVVCPSDTTLHFKNFCNVERIYMHCAERTNMTSSDF